MATTARLGRLTAHDLELIENAARRLLARPLSLERFDRYDALDVLDYALRTAPEFRLTRRDLRGDEIEGLRARCALLLGDARRAALAADGWVTLEVNATEVLDGDLYTWVGATYEASEVRHDVPTGREGEVCTRWTATWLGTGPDPLPGWHRYTAGGNALLALRVLRRVTPAGRPCCSAMGICAPHVCNGCGGAPMAPGQEALTMPGYCTDCLSG